MTDRARDFIFDIDNMRKNGATEERILELVEDYFRMECRIAHNQALLVAQKKIEQLQQP